jgi:hypothetical protein
MAHRYYRQGMIRGDLVESARKRGLCLANCALLELKEGVMMMHGKGDHAQEEARRQEQADASPDTRADVIAGRLGCFHDHAASYGITAIKSSIIKVKSLHYGLAVCSGFIGMSIIRLENLLMFS